MGQVVSVTNQKGGVAKTTTVACLGAALAEAGRRVLLVDLDPQSSLTFALGIDPDDVEVSIADVLRGAAQLDDAVLAAEEGLWLVPASLELSDVESMLLPVAHRELVLRRALGDLDAAFDVVLLDCSPSLGLLTINALATSDEVLVPLQAEMLSHRGVGQLLDTVADVARLLNPGLRVRGLLPTMYDGRSTHARAVLADIGPRYDLPVLGPIPRSVRFAEAPGLGRTVLSTAPRSPGAEAYRDVAAQLMRSWGIRRRRRPAGR